MEIKATLNKPFINKQRLDFIVEQNHVKGYEIKETEVALEAWGYTEEEIAEQQKQAQIAHLKSLLSDLDLQAIRALRAIQSGNGTEADTQILAELELQAQDIRQQIRDLNPPVDEESSSAGEEEQIDETQSDKDI